MSGDGRPGRGLRVVMLVESYFPRTRGGIEVYTRELAGQLRSTGHEVHFACPSSDPAAATDTADGVPVHFYPVPRALTREEERLETLPRGFESFVTLLDRLAPDVLHAHYLSGAAAVPQLERARAQGIATLLTVHFGAATCIRSTGRRSGTPMLRWGYEQCDGELRALRCSACLLQARGLPRPLAWSAAALEAAGVAVVADLDEHLGGTTALPAIVRRKRATLERYHAALDALVVSAEWQRGALLANGLADSRIHRVAHGVGATPSGTRRIQGEHAVFGWAGRPVPEKGLDELLDAFTAIDVPEARLHVACATSSAEDAAYRDRLVERYARDQRVQWMPAFAPEASGDFYRNVDVFVAPYAMETGPLTVVEAFAHGVPVIGSNVGGIRELVSDGIDGRLFAYRDAGSLRAALREALALETRRRWATAARWERSFADVAADYERLYRGAVSAAALRAASIPPSEALTP